ncbi:MAG: ATP phosphoribosyltransferase regulatory subunit, partial [Lachnospiraceae bacterium]|nr:ATP phosphoribosyltransferase regulatory subunit [Lachnospiraceae bacterium]
FHLIVGFRRLRIVVTLPVTCGDNDLICAEYFILPEQFFKGLCEECGIGPETEMELRDYISNKNYFGAQSILQAQNIADDIQEKLLKVTEMFGSIEKILSAKSIVNNERSLNAVLRLEKIHEILRSQNMEQYVTYDAGMLSKYHYYTGVIFKAYTYGIGDAIMKGGRYDNLLEAYGNPKPAVGFVIVVDDLMLALRSGHITVPVKAKAEVVTYNAVNMKEKLAYVCKLRSEGKAVSLVAED